MSLTIDRVERQYGKIKQRARRAFRWGDCDAALEELALSAHVAYSFNWIYSDPDSEELIKQISQALFGRQQLPLKTDRIVFYDAFGWDNRGLTQQYVRALNRLGVEFLFVFEKRDPHLSKAIMADLEQCGGRVEIFEIDRRASLVNQSRMLFDKIKEYAPSRAFLHLEPGSAMALCAFCAFPDITKYNIGLTDHAFWLGCGCVDYNIEFRDYGQTVSMEKRGLPECRILRLPYYPVQNEIPFRGWPNDPDETTVKIFSGSSFYKIYGENGRFFDLAKQILQDNPMAVIYFAGWGNPGLLNEFIRENRFEKRFFLLGNRVDIDAVFENCDIYLGTYPITGGLMSQYAAIHGKPILAYTSEDLTVNEVEGIVCHNRSEHITHYSEEEFFEYARKLCRDRAFRENEGKRLEGCVITPEQFIAGLNDVLVHNRSYKPYTYVGVDYRKWADLYLEVENNFQKKFERRFLRYRLSAFFRTPLLFLKSRFR